MSLMNTIRGLRGKGLESALNNISATEDDLLVKVQGSLLDMTYPVLSQLLTYDEDKLKLISDNLMDYTVSLPAVFEAFDGYMENGDFDPFEKTIFEFAHEKDEDFLDVLTDLYQSENGEQFYRLRFAFFPLQLMRLNGCNDSSLSLYSGPRCHLIYCENVEKNSLNKEVFGKLFPKSLFGSNSDIAFSRVAGMKFN